MRIDLSEFLNSASYGAVLDCSDTTISLVLTALSFVSKRYVWQDNGSNLSDVQWDSVSKIIGLANEEIMGNLIGFIIPNVRSNLSGISALPCDGSAYSKVDYPLLYDAIDSAYIIDASTFRVPDLRERVLVGEGVSMVTGDTGGESEHSLSIQEMPAHTHSYGQPSFNVDIESAGVPDPFAFGQPLIPTQTSSSGGGLPHNNMQPYHVVRWAIIAG